MASVVSRQTAGGNGVTYNPTFLGTGTDRLIMVIASIRSFGVDSNLTALTLDGAAADSISLLFRNPFDYYANTYVAFFSDTKHPGAGTFALTPTWSVIGPETYAIYELDGAPQSSPFITTPVIENFQGVTTAGKALSLTLLDAAGALGFDCVACADNSNMSGSTVTGLSANLANQVDQVFGGNRLWCQEDPSVDTASEVYSSTFGCSTIVSNVYHIAFALDAGGGGGGGGGGGSNFQKSRFVNRSAFLRR